MDTGFLSQFGELEDSIKDHCKIIIISSSEDTKNVLMMTNNPYVIDYWIKPIFKECIEIC